MRSRPGMNSFKIPGSIDTRGSLLLCSMISAMPGPVPSSRIAPNNALNWGFCRASEHGVTLCVLPKHSTGGFACVVCRGRAHQGFLVDMAARDENEHATRPAWEIVNKDNEGGWIVLFRSRSS